MFRVRHVAAQHFSDKLPNHPAATVPTSEMVSQFVVYSDAACSYVTALCVCRSEQVMRETVREPGPQNLIAVTVLDATKEHSPSTMLTSPNCAVPAASVLDDVETVVC